MYLSLIVDLTNAITEGSCTGGRRPFCGSSGGVEDGCDGDPLTMVFALSRVLLSIFRITDFVLDELLLIMRRGIPKVSKCHGVFNVLIGNK